MTIYIYWFRVIYILKLHSYLANFWSFYFVLCILNRLLGLFCSVKEHPFTKVPSLSNLTRSPRFVPPLVVEKCLNIRTWTGKEISRRKHLCLNRIWCAEKRWWHALFPNSVFRIHILNSLNVGFDWCPGNEVIPIRNYMLILELDKWFTMCIID